MFPAEKLIAAGGEIYCHLFENTHTGVPRNVYWSITINFHPIEYDGKRLKPCSMTCEWLTWPLRDWRQLEGQSLDLEYGDGGSESSFYLWEHHTGSATRLRIGTRDGARFDVAMEMVVDFEGTSAADRDPAMVVRAQALLPFIGVFVSPDGLGPEAVTPAEITSAVAPFLDPTVFQAPQPWRHTYRMEPLPGI
jgi:hypothetical protein